MIKGIYRFRLIPCGSWCVVVNPQAFKPKLVHRLNLLEITRIRSDFHNLTTLKLGIYKTCVKN